MLHEHNIVQADVFVHGQNILMDNLTRCFPDGRDPVNFSKGTDKDFDKTYSFSVRNCPAVIFIVCFYLYFNLFRNGITELMRDNMPWCIAA